MKAKLLLSLTCTAILASGCAVNSNTDYANVQPYASTTVPAAKTDAKVLGAMVVLNKNEIAAANQAEVKSSNPAVRNFAGMMIKQHTQNLQQTETVSNRLGLTPTNGPVANMLKSNGKRELVQLNRNSGHNYDKAYMSAMVKDHSAALKLLDTKLIPEASNPALKSQLEMTRGHVAQHLQMAEQTLSGL